MIKKYERIGGDFAPSYKFENPGDSIEGFVKSRKLVENEAFESGEAMFYNIVKSDDNQEVSIIGAGLLDKLMKEITDGEEVRITWNGKEKIKKGPNKGKTANRYTVERVIRSEASAA